VSSVGYTDNQAYLPTFGSMASNVSGNSNACETLLCLENKKLKQVVERFMEKVSFVLSLSLC
jgi:hypothetical protein